MPDEIPPQQKPQPVPPKEAKSKPAQRQLQIQARFAQQFSGPLPPPELLEHYERILPGAAERIFKMAENEQKHSHAVESTLPALAKRGQIFGFVLGMTGILGGVALVGLDKSIAGFGIFFVSLGSLLGAYLYGHKTAPQEKPTDEEKQQSQERRTPA